MSFSIQNGGFFHSHVNVYERVWESALVMLHYKDGFWELLQLVDGCAYKPMKNTIQHPTSELFKTESIYIITFVKSKDWTHVAQSNRSSGFQSVRQSENKFDRRRPGGGKRVELISDLVTCMSIYIYIYK